MMMTAPSQPESANGPSVSSLEELVDVMATLRGPGGCAWDAEQTHESLVQHLIEETHELIDAIETGSRADLMEELGDVLYQVLFHADIAAATEGERFGIQDVAAHMTQKMVRRHPHVFGDAVAETAAAVSESWDALKATEKPDRTSILDGIPQGMPSLALADKLIGRAQKIGLLEPDSATAPPAPSEAELGELLLSIVISAKNHGLNAERALRSALRTVQDGIREVETAQKTTLGQTGR